ncbi:hypothetical protein F5Y14DRAFT_286398 [Nemania sp. NC0429]|nr:hypothetical protein F5Y14DRAFT_286398 [Nemania sp. NC0429]
MRSRRRAFAPLLKLVPALVVASQPAIIVVSSAMVVSLPSLPSVLVWSARLPLVVVLRLATHRLPLAFLLVLTSLLRSSKSMSKLVGGFLLRLMLVAMRSPVHRPLHRFSLPRLVVVALRSPARRPLHRFSLPRLVVVAETREPHIIYGRELWR